jgi:prepilin-type processing-associated H-X9-DG protein
VQKAREAAARLSCTNNLKQIGLAMHMYHNDQDRFPPSRLAGGRATWAVLILPYLEQDNLYRQWGIGYPYYQQNAIARTSAVKGFFCPSRRSAGGATGSSISGDVPSDGSSSVNVPGALGDYAVSVDRSGTDNSNGYTAGLHGAFQLSGGLRFADFIDGTSGTLLVGEKNVPQGKEGQGWWDNSLYNGDYHTSCSRAAGRSYPLTTNPQDTGWKFGSRHTGVVNFCFADGGVRRLSETIDPLTLELLGMRDDGQVIPDY